MKSVKVEITPGKAASRAEVIIRIIYGIIAWIILAIFGFIACILWVVNFLTCLILAQRVAPGFLAAIARQYASLWAYWFFVTDERPPIIPEF